MYGFIYITTNIINNKKYIGRCKKRYMSGYLGSGSLLKLDIKKYGKEDFQREIVEWCHSEDELSLAEQSLILFYDAVSNAEFYNIKPGGKLDAGQSYKNWSKSLQSYWQQMTPEERKTARRWSIKPRPRGKDNPRTGVPNQYTINKFWCNNGIEQKMVKELPEGFIKGRLYAFSKESKETRSRKAKGTGNNMYGRSIVKEKNLRWYNNGIKIIYVSEGLQPEGYNLGRKLS